MPLVGHSHKWSSITGFLSRRQLCLQVGEPSLSFSVVGRVSGKALPSGSTVGLSPASGARLTRSLVSESPQDGVCLAHAVGEHLS